MIDWLDPALPAHFPATKYAQQEPNGLLAAGGLLNPEWLLLAYSLGVFPWFNGNEPILWWTPSPRTVLFPQEFRINRSFNKFLNKNSYRISTDLRFKEVMQACSDPRKGQAGSWISSSMVEAYTELFHQGYAHSYECWDANNVMVGGLYGVAIGQVFFGESMFSHAPNASKCCLKSLVDSDHYQLIDCQMATAHMHNMGAKEIERELFEKYLLEYTAK